MASPSINWTMPDCVVPCVATACGSPSLDQAQWPRQCFCPNRLSGATPWRSDLASCLWSNCSSLDYFTAAGITYHTCDIPNTVETSLVTLIAVTSTVQLVFFSAKMASIHKRQDRGWGRDDKAFLITSLLLLITLPVVCFANHYGFLVNIWTTQIWRIDMFAKLFFAYSILYAVSLGMTKMTIIFLYMRIFRGQSMKLHYILWATQAVNVSIIIIFVLGLFFACQPLQYYWTYAETVDGTCPDPIDKGLVYTVLNVSMDVWMIILPATQVWTTSSMMSWQTKAGVTFMFGLGLLTASTSIFRVLAYRDNVDRWLLGLDDIYTGLKWSVIEVTIAYVISCAPAARIVVMLELARLRQRVTGSKEQESNVIHMGNIHVNKTPAINSPNTLRTNTNDSISDNYNDDNENH